MKRGELWLMLTVLLPAPALTQGVTEPLELELQHLLSLREIKRGHFITPDGSVMTAPPPTIDSRLNSVLIAPC